MRPIFRIAALILAAGAATAALAQTQTSQNPLHRNQEDVFRFGPHGGTFATGNVANETGFGRPMPRSFQGAVTPVPEPSQWAMMLAGLGLVAFVVRRSRRS